MFNPEALMIGISLCPLPNKDNYRYLKKTVYVGGASEEGERNVRIFPLLAARRSPVSTNSRAIPPRPPNSR